MHIDYTVYSEGKLGMILDPKDLVTNVAMTKEKLEKKILRAKSLVPDETAKNILIKNL